ncbi:MAG: hypothetical protein ACLQOO_13710 [Terriglobia bacterium]
MKVFRFGQNNVKQVLECGGLGAPEFVDGFVLNYTGRIMKGDCILPTKAEIYDWDGKMFKLAATAAYDDRFEALARLVRAKTTQQIESSCCGAPNCLDSPD